MPDSFFQILSHLDGAMNALSDQALRIINNLESFETKARALLDAQKNSILSSEKNGFRVIEKLLSPPQQKSPFREMQTYMKEFTTGYNRFSETISKTTLTFTETSEKQSAAAERSTKDLDRVSTSARKAISILDAFTGESHSVPYDGSHAAGLWSVPYDGYVAQLHRGERVLSASQTRQNDAAPINAAAIAEAIKQATVGLASSLTIELDRKVVGKVVGDATTRRVHKNIDLANSRNAYDHGN